MNAQLTFRLLTPKDNIIFQAIRLRACREEPASFLEAYEDLVTLPPERFDRYFDNGWIAGAFVGDTLVGITGLYRHKGMRIQHKGTVWGVYVAPEARGQGCSKYMLEMVLEEAKNVGLELVMLSTDATNPITIRLYQSLGFIPYGVEKHTLKLADDHYVDDMWMMKFLQDEMA